MIRYLPRNRFSVVGNICLILQISAGAVVLSYIVSLRSDEVRQFTCNVQTTYTIKKAVENSCYLGYQHAYDSPMPLYGFAVMSIAFPVLISVWYSSAVSFRIEEIDRTSNEDDESRTNGEIARIRVWNATAYVFSMYLIQLAFRFVLGIIFTILQLLVFFPSGFDSQFTCRHPTPEIHVNVTSKCVNGVAAQKEMCDVVLTVSNILFAVVALGELVYFGRRHSVLNCRSENGWMCDAQFVTVYLLRKQYHFHIQELPEFSFSQSVDYYKQQILMRSSLPGIYYSRSVSLDSFFIDCVMFAQQAPPKFHKQMDGHEIFEVYMRVPQESIPLLETVDLFNPNADTEGRFPRKILVIGQPGMGKTLLTEKIMFDWAKEVDPFYCGKIVLYFKCRWLSFDKFKCISFKQFCCHCTKLSMEKFETIFEVISAEPSRAIFIFDGLDELCLDDSDWMEIDFISSDFDTKMSGKSLLMKLVGSKMLAAATVLVTSRPTADFVFSKIDFDRSVDILGFSREKIKQYVYRFCENHNRSDLKQMMMNEIESSSDLLTLCQIPVSCFVVCASLIHHYTEIAAHPFGEHPLTLTTLYTTLVEFIGKCHNRVLDKMSNILPIQLQYLAYIGMQNGEFVFSEESVDEPMKNSGLLQRLPGHVSCSAVQFCFIYVTVQEFLAAKYVIETCSPNEIECFILSHVDSDRWHLVLKFVHELLQEKVRISSSEAYTKCIELSQEAVEHIEAKND